PDLARSLFPFHHTSPSETSTLSLHDALPICSASRRKISPKYRRNPAYSALRRHLGMNTTWYLHSHFVWFRLSYSSIADLLFVCFSGSRSGVSAMDSSKCQTLTATPAEPGELPTELVG